MTNKSSNNIVLTACLFFLIISFWGLPLMSRAAEPVEIYFFYGQGCPHCANEEVFLNGLNAQYPSVQVKAYEVYNNQTNRELLTAMAQAYGKQVEGVPTTFIADQVFVGDDASIESAMRSLVEGCLQTVCPSPLDKLDQSFIDNNQPVSDQNKSQNLGWWILGGIGIIVVGFIIWTLMPKRKTG